MARSTAFASVLFLLACTNAALAAPARNPLDEDPALEQGADELVPFNGKTIAQIRVEGLVRTSEKATRGLLRQHEGDRFDADRWQEGIQNLYNTGALYDLRTDAKIDPTGPSKVSLTITLKDKWTLFPYAEINIGGGLRNYAVGLIDFNFLGTFTNAYIQVSTYNGDLSYELNAYQEWLGYSDFMGWVDVSKNLNPVVSIDGIEGRNFTWSRVQQEFMFGKKFSLTFRAFAYLDLFNDAISSTTTGLEPRVIDGEQYKIRPFAVFGKVNSSNYLEKGEEFRIAPTFANFFSSDSSYSSLTLTYKSARSWTGRDNFAYFAGVSAMTPVPLPYQLHLGGFDSVRGFAAFQGMGRYSASGNVEYRPYFFQLKTPLLDIDRVVVQGNVFADAGRIWGSSTSSGEGSLDHAQTLVSAGAGLRAFFLHYEGAIMRIDVARTISPDQGFGVALGIGQFF